MTCTKCQHANVKKFGTHGSRRIQRYRCAACKATFSEPRSRPLGTHYTDVADAARVVALLTEGMSIRAASRLTGLHKNTISSLILTLGDKCNRLHDGLIRNVRPNRAEADELWGYVHTKEKHLRPGCNPEWGDQYIWIALDPVSKVVLAFHVGKRDGANAHEFMQRLSERIDGKFQLTTDGLDSYIGAVDEFFGADVDYAQLHKVYSRPKSDGPDWYQPAPFVRTYPRPLRGTPQKQHISTSHVERFNLSVRMHMKRCARLGNAFSKSLKHFRAAVAIFIAWYNFCRTHESIRCTPAMEARLTDRIWTIEELISASTDI